MADEEEKKSQTELEAEKDAGVSKESLAEEDKFIYSKAEDVSEKSVEAVSKRLIPAKTASKCSMV
jgi:hypothetical protein